jgi:hypothetical protein
MNAYHWYCQTQAAREFLQHIVDCKRNFVRRCKYTRLLRLLIAVVATCYVERVEAYWPTVVYYSASPVCYTTPVSTSYYAPATTTYYTASYAPVYYNSAPVTTYYAPSSPVTSYYAPATTSYSYPVVNCVYYSGW